MARCPNCGDDLAEAVVRCPRDGTLVGEAPDPYIGATLAGRYKLVARLGRGGMSSVYLARHVVIERLAAVKILRAEFCRNATHRDRFLREARAVNRIHHENIIEITDYGEAPDSVVFLVMEYVPGDSLMAHISRGRLTPMRALEIARQIASGLARAHQMNVVHRDLKPDNVLVTTRDDGSELIKVLDFGIAKLLDAPALTLGNKIFGTPGYIAPEYATGGQITPRTDLYSLGVVLYEMVTGTLPFEAEFAGDLILKHVLEPPIPPRRRVPSLPESLEALVLQCLAKKPEDRHRDAFHLLEDIARVRSELLLDAPPLPESMALRDVVRDASENLHIEGVPSRVPVIPQRVSLVSAPPSEPSQPLAPWSPPPTPADGIDAADQPFELLGLAAPMVGESLDAPRHWEGFLEALKARLGQVFWVDAPPEVRAPIEAMVLRLQAMHEEVARAELRKVRMLALESKGREFRASIGRAIDALAADLSARAREREAVLARQSELEALRHRTIAEGTQTRSFEALVWELATVSEVARRVVRDCEDLEFQLSALASQTERLNEALESDQSRLIAELTRGLTALTEGDAALKSLLRELSHRLDGESPR